MIGRRRVEAPCACKALSLGLVYSKRRVDGKAVLPQSRLLCSVFLQLVALQVTLCLGIGVGSGVVSYVVLPAPLWRRWRQPSLAFW